MTAKIMILLDENGQELARFDTVAFAQAGNGPTGSPEIPKTLDWYREATKWLVATAAATLILGLGYFGETRDTLLRLAFTLAGVCLIAALTAGTLGHLWMIEFGKLWENRDNLSGENAIAANDNAQDKYLRWIRRAYGVLLWTLFSGMTVFGIACGIRIWNSTPQPAHSISTRPTADELLLTNPSTGETWIAAQDSTGAMSWKRKIPPRSKE